MWLTKFLGLEESTKDKFQSKSNHGYFREQTLPTYDETRLSVDNMYYQDILKKRREMYIKEKAKLDFHKKSKQIIISEEDNKLLNEYKRILRDIETDSLIKDAWNKFLIFRKLRKP